MTSFEISLHPFTLKTYLVGIQSFPCSRAEWVGVLVLELHACFGDHIGNSQKDNWQGRIIAAVLSARGTGLGT